MTRIAVLDDYQRVAMARNDWAKLPADCAVETFQSAFSGLQETAAALSDFDVVCLMRERTPFPRALLASLPRLRCLVTTGLGNASVDLAAARDHGVAVCHTRSGPTGYTTCELAWGLILSASRSLQLEDRRIREGCWQTTIGPMLYGKTLGLLGLGRLGARMAAIGAAFGMRVIAWSPHLDARRAQEAGAEFASKDDLFAASDVLSLHLVLSGRTRGIVGAAELERMKPDALFVNTARAGLVDEAALIRVLEAGRIAGAALDVFEQEPLPASHPFARMSNVLLSPHLGYVTHDSYDVFFQDVVEDIVAFLEGAPIRVLSSTA